MADIGEARDINLDGRIDEMERHVADLEKQAIEASKKGDRVKAADLMRQAKEMSIHIGSMVNRRNMMNGNEEGKMGPKEKAWTDEARQAAQAARRARQSRGKVERIPGTPFSLAAFEKPRRATSSEWRKIEERVQVREETGMIEKAEHYAELGPKPKPGGKHTVTMGGKVRGRHGSRAEAVAQVQAINLSKLRAEGRRDVPAAPKEDKAWTDEARAAAAEARRGLGARPPEAMERRQRYLRETGRQKPGRTGGVAQYSRVRVGSPKNAEVIEKDALQMEVWDGIETK